MKRVFFPGSFNPFTKGHADILNRLLRLSDTAVIGIGVNAEKPSSAETAEKNAEKIAEYLKREGLESRVNVVIYSGLTGEEAKKNGADCMARGVRGATDFEYEYQLAAVNRELFGIETLLIPANPALAGVSSTAARDLQRHGREDLAAKLLP